MHRFASTLLALGMTACGATCDAARFVDVLDTPAQVSTLATRSLLQAVTRAGERLIAVGQRGHILLSDDGGNAWRQARVPVSSDLTAVCFVDAKHGWAVGNDAVVLHTDDAGDTWHLQLDGVKGNELLVAAMKQKADAEPHSEQAKKLLAEALRFQAQGPDMPLLDVWFTDRSTGFVVGASNLIYRTSDGGKSWAPWFDRTDNPKLLNLYSIRAIGSDVYIAGESGLVLKLDRETQRFRALELPYNGSLFGLVAAKNAVLAFGLRGNAFRSEDGGRSWTKVDTRLAASIVAATHTATDTTLIADASGRIVATSDGGRSFAPVALKLPTPITGFVETDAGRFVLVGPRGVTTSTVVAR